MTWWAVEVHAAPEAQEEVASWLVGHTGHAVEERDGRIIVGFAPSEYFARQLESELRSTFPSIIASGFHPVETVDWGTRWREGLGPRRTGRLTLLPSWIPAPADSDLIVALDPETAFGSGEHGSTRAALALLERLLVPGMRVIDLGSGSGILAIAAVKLGARHAFGIEIDPEAMPVALRNAERNLVEARVQFLEGDALVLAPLCGPADLILSNILREPNVQLLPMIGAALAPDGIAVFSGMEQPEAPLFRPELERAGFHPLAEAVDEGWWAIAAVRR
jgi:ribosomal protein L11 methyltransferase